MLQVKASFVNPELLERQDIPLDQLLEDEAIGMAFPVDARYFDQFPLIFDDANADADVVGMQHPQNPHSGLQQSVRDLVNTRYGETHLEPPGVMAAGII